MFGFNFIRSKQQTQVINMRPHAAEAQGLVKVRHELGFINLEIFLTQSN